MCVLPVGPGKHALENWHGQFWNINDILLSKIEIPQKFDPIQNQHQTKKGIFQMNFENQLSNTLTFLFLLIEKKF